MYIPVALHVAASAQKLTEDIKKFNQYFN